MPLKRRIRHTHPHNPVLVFLESSPALRQSVILQLTHRRFASFLCPLQSLSEQLTRLVLAHQPFEGFVAGSHAFHPRGDKRTLAATHSKTRHHAYGCFILPLD